MLYTAVAFPGLTVLLVAEQSAAPQPADGGLFLDAMFEVFSALGTVGLSTGLTPHLARPGKMVMIVLMFIGGWGRSR